MAGEGQLLTPAIALRDIRDVDAFVGAAIEQARRRHGLHFPPSEREELHAEGVMILYELARGYEPHRPGYVGPGRFAGYAARFLSGRIADAWHRWHPEHRRVGSDGARRWDYGQPPAPLEEIERMDLIAWDPYSEDSDDRVEAALDLLEPWQRLGARALVDQLAGGAGWEEAGEKLGLGRGRLRRLREDLAAALDRAGRMEAAA